MTWQDILKTEVEKGWKDHLPFRKITEDGITFADKAALDLYTSFMRPRFSAGIGGQSGLLKICDKTYEEMSGEKLEDNS